MYASPENEWERNAPIKAVVPDIATEQPKSPAPPPAVNVVVGVTGQPEAPST
jgi:hypothetical protein